MTIALPMYYWLSWPLTNPPFGSGDRHVLYYKLNVEKWWVDLGCWMIFKVQNVTIQTWIIFKKSEKSEISFVFWTHDLHPKENTSCPKFQRMGQHEPPKKNSYFPLYRLFNRDPYKCFIFNPHITGWLVSYTIHVWYIYLHLAGFVVNVGKYTIHGSYGYNPPYKRMEPTCCRPTFWTAPFKTKRQTPWNLLGQPLC